MNKLAMSSALFGGIFAAMLSVAPASAQATRTWVSGVGDDANPCSRTAPCKTFAGAISKTAALGEINVLDPGGFGGVTIGKSLTISSTFEAGVLVSGTNAIIINLPNPTDRVELSGLDIEGLGTGLDGVKVLGTGKIVIRNTRINGFTGNGVNSVGTANANVTIMDCFITNNGGGVNIAGAGNVAQAGFLGRSVVSGNTSFAVQANGSNSGLSVANSVLLGSPTLVSLLNSGVVVSFGPSNVANGATFSPPSPIAFK